MKGSVLLSRLSTGLFEINVSDIKIISTKCQRGQQSKSPRSLLAKQRKPSFEHRHLNFGQAFRRPQNHDLAAIIHRSMKRGGRL